MELRSLGDAYVRDEFKRHKDADVNFVPVFMTEWTVSIYTQQGHIHTERKRTRKRKRPKTRQKRSKKKFLKSKKKFTFAFA